MLFIWEKHIINLPSTPSQQTTQPTPTPDETANWKTYTNKKYGFQLKYPFNYQVSEGEVPKGYGFIYSIAFHEPLITGQTHIPSIGIYIYEKGGQSLKEVYESNKSTNFKDSIDVKEGIVNSLRTLQFIKTPDQQGMAVAGRHVLFELGNYAIDVTDVSNIYEDINGIEENSTLKPIFDQILSTFRFTQ